MRVEGARKRFISATVVAIVVVLAVFGGSAPAHADGDYGNYVDGVGSVNNDWSDNPEICYGCSRSNTDQVILWQLILYADGFLSYNQVDGQFGPNTKAATRNWQSYKGGLNVDGRAGPKTWGKADDALWSHPDGPNGMLRVVYSGRYGGSVWMYRGWPGVVRTDGTYQVHWASQWCSPGPGSGRLVSTMLPTAERSISTTSKTFGMYLEGYHGGC